MDSCPCGFGEPYDECCGRYHRGEAEPPTATTLMRARYSAFAVGDEDFLMRTGQLSTRPAGQLIDPTVRWTGLFITGSSAGGLLDDQGTVEFVARFTVLPSATGPQPSPARSPAASSTGERGTLTENSRFIRVDGRWSYLGPT